MFVVYFFFILSDILHSTAHSQYVMVYGIVGTWLSSPRTFIGSWSVVGFSALWYYPIAVWYHPIVGYYPLIVRFSLHRYYTPIVG